MSENVISNENNEDWAFTEGCIEYMLRGGASLETCARALFIYNIYYKLLNPNLTDIDTRLEEWVLSIKDLINVGGKEEKKKRQLQDELTNLFETVGEGSFSLADCYNWLNITDSGSKTACRMALNRLISRELIQREGGGKSGRYRIVNQKAAKIDIRKADTKPLLLKLPLQINEYVNIYKGNVIIISGESNAGKTAMCLNIAHMNRELYHVNYLSSEMQDGTELKLRLDEFNRPMEDWDLIDFRFRTDNFPDVVDPRGLNIIDYMDEGKGGEAYQVPRRIRDISEKLKDGLAIIALQKDSQKTFAFGGEGTMNTSRLYMTITRQGVLKINKAKVWRNRNINPNGMYCNFKLVAGCKFIIDGAWRRKDD
jgi:hypothetical protein